MESELRLVYAVNLPVQSAILNHPKCVRINLLDCLYTVAAKWQSNRKCSVCVQCCWLRNNIILVYTATEQISLAVDIIHTLSLHFGLKYCEGLRRKYFNPSDKALFRPTKLQCFPIDTTWNIDVLGRKSDKLHIEHWIFIEKLYLQLGVLPGDLDQWMEIQVINLNKIFESWS